MIKYWIKFKMTSSSESERVYSNKKKTNDEWEEYFEKSCGGVYKWWRE